MNGRTLPDAPALPEHSTDATGVQTGNADIETPEAWAPWPGPNERPPLPGHEHQVDPASKAWPWLSEGRAFALAIALVGLALGATDFTERTAPAFAAHAHQEAQP